MIGIIDYRAGNLTSVARALRYLGYSCEVTHDLDRLRRAERIIFPGVGAAGQAMADLKDLGLEEFLKETVHQGRPLMGICLGTQIIFEASEEDGGTPCLGLLPGVVKRFPDPLLDKAGQRLKVPHMGWNQVRWEKEHPVFSGLDPAHEFYFVHSYFPAPADEDIVCGRTDHGIVFVSAVAKDNMVAVQFHPEKSGRPGLKILDNFCKWRP
ncbi:imidazole glycerol phosphate synthase subunit HisH [Thermosulfuriphilus sp.]